MYTSISKLASGKEAKERIKSQPDRKEEYLAERCCSVALASRLAFPDMLLFRIVKQASPTEQGGIKKEGGQVVVEEDFLTTAAELVPMGPTVLVQVSLRSTLGRHCRHDNEILNPSMSCIEAV